MKEKRGNFIVPFILSKGYSFKHLCFISMYSVWNTLSEYSYFCTSKNILLYALLLVIFKIVESLQCILKVYFLSTCVILQYNTTCTVKLLKYFTNGAANIASYTDNTYPMFILYRTSLNDYFQRYSQDSHKHISWRNLHQ